MRRRDAKLQSDAQRRRQRHPPSASLSGRREGAGREGGVEGGRGGVLTEHVMHSDFFVTICRGLLHKG